MDDDGFVVGSCENCEGTDFIVDYERGDRICAACGAVDSRLMVATSNFKEVFDCQGTRVQFAPTSETFRCGAYHEELGDAIAQERDARRTKSAPYKAITYFSERISQWRMQEPGIPPADWDAIEQMHRCFIGTHLYYSHRQYAGDHYFEPRWEPDKEHFSKEDVRTLLWEIDKREPVEAERRFVVSKF